jgi:CelD/BcsL family acetyltransferase involved in cellulose biosynthesis
LSQDVLSAGVGAGLAFDVAEPHRATGVGVRSARRPHLPRATDIAVEIASGARLADVQPDWEALVARADAANVFMNPLMVKLDGETDPERRRVVLLAWFAPDGERRLAGVWAFSIRRPSQSMLPLDVLTAPAMAHGYLATPVIDRDALEPTLEAMLTAIASDPRLPNLVALDAMTADGATMQALSRVLAVRGSPPCVLAQASRPMLASELDGKRYLEQALSGSSRKKLRQYRRRLGEKGTLGYKVLTAPTDIERGLEEFLALEAAGWKGRQGSALVNDMADAAFTRAMITGLAPRGEAAIHALTLDGKPVSMQIVLRAGTTAFTWKTAYDETQSDYSPGMLLLEDYTTSFLADPGIARVDSCAYDEASFMSAWRERQAIATVWFDARPGGSAIFGFLTRLQRTFLRARSAAKAVYLTHVKKRTH